MRDNPAVAESVEKRVRAQATGLASAMLAGEEEAAAAE
jgi:hypothetical protein